MCPNQFMRMNTGTLQLQSIRFLSKYLLNQGEDMIQILLRGLSPGGTNKDDACEVVAHDTI